MGQVVAGGAGAIVGSFFGMPGLGYTIGSALYGVFNKPPGQNYTQTPIDLRVFGTEYGQALCYLRGSYRMAPQIMYNSDRIPLTTVTEIEGGGGKGSTPTSTQETITYSIDMFNLFTENQIIGVSRIWDSGDLIWRTDSGASIGTISASNAAEHWERLTIFSGADDQAVDPDYETAIDTEVAPNSAPAYRQRGSAFVKGLQLGQSGQLRNLTYEVVADGAQGPQITYFDGLTTPDQTNHAASCFDTLAVQVWTTDESHSNTTANPDRVGIYDFDDESWEYVVLPGRNGSNWELVTDDMPAMQMFPDNDCVLIGVRDTDGGAWYDTLVYRISDRQLLGIYKDLLALSQSAQCLTINFANLRALVTHANDYLLVNVNSNGVPSTILTTVTPPSGGSGSYGRAHIDADNSYWVNRGSTSGWGRITSGGVYTLFAPTADSIYDDKWAHCYDPTRDCIYFWSDNGSPYYILKLNCADGAISRVNASGYVGTDFKGSLHYASDLDAIVAVHAPSAAADGKIRIIDPDDGTIETTYVIPDLGGNRFIGGTTYAPGVVWGPALDGFGEYRFNVITPSCPTVADVQQGLCVRAGLTAGQVDVTELSSITRTVCCFPITQVSPTREPTERLMGVYFYECTMSGRKVKFVPRGGSAVATIPYEDLNASRDGASESDPFPLRKINDLESPAFKAVTYINISNDYQQDTQLSDRLLSATSASIETAQIAIGMTPSEAKAVADTHSLDQAASIAGCEITIMRLDYPTLEPTDPIIVTAADGSLVRMRIVEMTEEFPLCRLRLVLDDTSVLTSQGITSVDYNSQTTVTGPVATLMELIDAPILQDSDDDAGFYTAAKGASTPWPGAAIFDSSNGVDYARRVTHTASAVFGTCTTTLGDWYGPHVIDERNTITVNVGNGTLASSTRALVIASQAVNAMMIGSELIQFITATLVSPGVYTLSRLIRGSRGTEWAMVDHASSERCVLLTEAGLRRIVLTNSQLGDSRQYKGVTLGRSIGTATARSFVDTGIGLKPFAPVDARVTRDGSNNATITWRRRTRMSTRYVGTMGISVPLGEESEAYVVEIYGTEDSNLTTVLRTISATSATASYSAAEQTADGITPGDGFFFAVYQISAIVGSGYALEHFG